MKIRFFSLGLLCTPWGLFGGPLEKVKPFLETHCYDCHGVKKQKGDVRFDSLGDDLTKIENLENLNEDLSLAARHALLQMIDYLVDEHGLTREQAYVLSSVAVDLRIGQVVDIPNYVVTATMNWDVFDKYRHY